MTELANAASCSGCDAKWNGLTRRSHCSACHVTFATPRGFDAHRWARGRGYGCYTPEELGLTERNGTWYIDMTGDDPKKWE